MIYVVCDLGFGDSGKGSIVDYLLSKVARRNSPTLVVRYCGGYQAAHHVVHEGVRRRYCQIGSGSLNYPNVDTYIGPRFIFSPEHLTREAKRNMNHSRDSGYTYIDPHCLVATHYARHLNKSSYNQNDSIATCGAGIGVTREYWLKYGQDALFAKDIAGPLLYDKLELMRQRLCPTYNEVANYSVGFGIMGMPQLKNYENIIFEGSQGVLLDENYGVGAPDHVTWSTTTMLHAKQLLAQYNFPEHEVRKIGVLRAYHTRHGSGPFQEDASLTSRLAPLEVDNLNSGPQGRFRFGKLQPNLIEYALSVPNVDVDEIAVTCLDQLTEEEAKESLKTISDFKPVKIESWGCEACHKKDSATLVLPSYS